MENEHTYNSNLETAENDRINDKNSNSLQVDKFYCGLANQGKFIFKFRNNLLS